MSTSNSTNYTLTATELITSALEPLGVAKSGEPLEPEESAMALVVLNMMLKALQNKLNLWKRKAVSITLVDTQTAYTLGQKSAGNATSLSAGNLVDSGANFNTDNVIVGDTVKNIIAGTSTTVSAVTSTTALALAVDIFTVGSEAYEITSDNISAPRPMKILECSRVRSDGNEVPLRKSTSNEYESESNKTSAGAPISYYYDKQLNNGILNIWQAPDASAVSEYTLRVVYQSPIEDIDLLTETIDCPSENLEALQMNLTYRLASRFGGLTASERAVMRQDAKDALDDAEGFDVDANYSTYFQPDMENY
jgi:hypothetical protein